MTTVGDRRRAPHKALSFLARSDMSRTRRTLARAHAGGASASEHDNSIRRLNDGELRTMRQMKLPIRQMITAERGHHREGPSVIVAHRARRERDESLQRADARRRQSHRGQAGPCCRPAMSAGGNAGRKDLPVSGGYREGVRLAGESWGGHSGPRLPRPARQVSRALCTLAGAEFDVLRAPAACHACRRRHPL